jgi:hypothetical protein
MIVIQFFRDVLDGIWYWLYLFICIIVFFYFLGIVADNKREKINKKLKEKKTYDIESGREAAIAAMETKQVLAVDDDQSGKLNDMANGNSTVEEAKKEGQEEVPAVLELSSSDAQGAEATTQAPAEEAPAVVQPAVVQPAVVQPAVVPPATQEQTPKAEEPLVIS